MTKAAKTGVKRNLTAGGSPERAVNLGFVNLGNDSRPVQDKEYAIVTASDNYLSALPYPTDTEFRRLHLDLYSFYVDNLPDFGKHNEGLLKVIVNTRDPQNLEGSPNDATVATSFEVDDGNYAPSFLFKGVFRNVLFREWINLRFDLYELDTDADEYFDKIKNVVNGVPEIKNLDILKGIPYLNLATQLFESIIKTFGKNPDDHIWGEVPMLELNPTPGGAFLRNGIYILFEIKNSASQEVLVSDLMYKNGKITKKKSSRITAVPNHLIAGISLQSHRTK